MRQQNKSADEYTRSSGHAKCQNQHGLNSSSPGRAHAEKNLPQDMPLEIRVVKVLPFRRPNVRYICGIEILLQNNAGATVQVTGMEINILRIRSEKRKEQEIGDMAIACDLKQNKVFVLHQQMKPPTRIRPQIDNEGNTGPFPNDWIIALPANGEHKMRIYLVDSWLEPDEIKTAEVQVIIETSAQSVSTEIFSVSFGNLSYIEEAANSMIHE